MTKVSAAIIERNGKLLLARRSNLSVLAGYWEFPGGKIQPGETAEACLARELEEEFGIFCEIGDLVAESKFSYPHGMHHILAFRARILAGEIQLTVHDQIEWVSIAELPQYRLLPADEPIAKALIRAQST